MVRLFSAITAIGLVSSAWAQAPAKLERLIELKGLPQDAVPVISTLAIHPEGAVLATAGDDHIVRLWDIRTGKLLRQLRGHRDWVTAVTFANGGRELVTGSRDRHVLVWDVQTGRLKGRLGKHQHAISGIVVSSRAQVAIAGFRAPLKVLDLGTGQLVHAFPCPCTDMRALAFSPDGKQLAAGGRTGVVRVWDLASGSHVDLRAMQRRVRALLFVPEKQELVVAGEAAHIGIWSLTERKRVVEIPHRMSKVLATTMLGDARFAAAGSDNLVRVYSLGQTRPDAVLRGHTGSIGALASRRNQLISGSFDTTVRVWGLPAPALTRPTVSTRRSAPDAPQ